MGAIPWHAVCSYGEQEAASMLAASEKHPRARVMLVPDGEDEHATEIDLARLDEDFHTAIEKIAIMATNLRTYLLSRERSRHCTTRAHGAASAGG